MDENQKNRMATIIAGLAASGHYTYLKQVGWNKKCRSKTLLRFEPWEEESELSRYDIIEDALTIFQELEKVEL